MARSARSTSITGPLLLIVATALAAAPDAAAQQPGAKLAEPATVEEAARVLDLRTFPMLEGARVHMHSLGILVYSGKGSPKEGFEFQRRELAKRGFRELPGRNRDITATHGDFTKDGFHVSAGASEVTGEPEKVGWSRVNLVNYGNVAVDKLPAPPGVKLNHAEPQRVSYTTSVSPTETAAACRKLLLAAGWEPYGETPSPHPDQPDASMQFFKRNAIRLESWIMTVELKGKKSTSISYDAELLSADLPAPAGATKLDYDDWQTNLTFDLPQGKSDALLAFYEERLSKQGWKATTEKPIVDDRNQSQFLVYRNPQRDLISVSVAQGANGVHARLNHQTAAEVAEEERLLKAEAELAKQELARKNMRIKIAVPLPPAAQKLKKKDASEFEFSLKTGSGPAALETLREHFLRDGWTEGKGEEFDKRRGSLNFKKDGDEVGLRYFDLGDVDITVSGSERIVLEPVPSKDAPPAGAPKAATQPAAVPAIPGLPALPPGIELPPDVDAFLKKAFQDATKKTPPAKKPAPAKSPPSAKTPPAKKAPTVTVHSVPAAKTFQRVAAEKPLGSIGDLDLSKRDNNKPNFWVSPDGRRFAYLIEKQGIVIDGKEYMYPNMYQGGVKERTFRFSPDSRHTAWVSYVGEQGDTLVLDGVPEKKGWNFIDGKGAEFSHDSQHIAYIARRYARGDVEYSLTIDGKEREVFKESPAWSLSFTTDGRRVVWGERVGERTQMRETSVDGSEPRIERSHGPSLLTINFFFGGGGQMGYVASDGPEKHFIFYDGKDDSLRFKELHQRDVLLSTDGKHLAYVAEPDSFRRVVVVDGKQSKVYGGFDADYVKDSLTLSPDGRRSAYAIKKRNDHFAVIDGREGKAYRAVSGLVFSPDSKRVAYRAVLGNKLLIVVDGQEGPGYDELGLPVFSPDGKSVACGAGAGTGKSKFIVLNGRNQKAYGDVGEPEFSPDGKRLVYEAEVEAGGQSLLIDSGREGKLYDDVKDRRYFSDDGRRLAMVVFEGDHQMVVVDGVEGNRYDTVITLGGGKVHFDSPDGFHYLAAKGGELYLVEETIQP